MFQVTMTLPSGEKIGPLTVSSVTIEETDQLLRSPYLPSKDVSDAVQQIHSYAGKDESYTTSNTHCTCPDFLYRKLGTANACKHILDQYGRNNIVFPVEMVDFLQETKKTGVSRKIQAIKALRAANQHNGMGLREAKDHVDGYLARSDF